MAIIKFTNSKAKLKTIINYVTRTDKTDENIITGKDCMASSSLEEMLAIKQLYNKTNGRQYIHLVQSFDPKDNIKTKDAHQIGVELANYFSGFQVLIVTHKDKEHIHNHLIINSVNFENGKKFSQSKIEMQEVKDYSDKLCQSAGIGIIEKKNYESIYNKNEYQVAVKGESWKIRLVNAIDYSIANSKTKDEYFKQMKNLGFEVVWTQNRIYITYTTPEGYKCRDNKLNNPKYLKGEMENAFNGRNKENEQIGNTTKSGDFAKTNSNGICAYEPTAITRNNNMESTINGKYERNKKFDRERKIGYGQNETRFTRKIDRNGKFGNYEKVESVDRKGQELQQTEYDFQDKSSCNRSTSRSNNRINSKSITLMAINLLESFSNSGESGNIELRNIKKWKDMSKQEKRDWYYNHRMSSGFNWDEEMEIYMLCF